MAAWVAAPGSRISDQIFKLVRNPYFVGVDKAGNQLPYLDEVHLKFFADANALNLAAIAGELDQQERHDPTRELPVLKETSQKTGKYNIYLWSSLGGADADIIFNQTYTKDPELGKLLANKDFRIAMSYAINRKQIQESAFLGTGEPRNPSPRRVTRTIPATSMRTSTPSSSRTLANQMLDKLGIDKKDAEGFRLYPERQAGRHRALGGAGLWLLSRHCAIDCQGLAKGRHPVDRPDSRARAAFLDARIE